MTNFSVLTEIRQNSLVCVPLFGYHTVRSFVPRKRSESPTTVLAIGHAGIRLHKYEADTTSYVQFEFDWDGIRNFEIVNKKLILRPENQPSCRKMTFHCGYYERARYLLDLITQAHIFDYNQTQMFPPEKEKKPINNFHRELSVDEYAPKPEYDRKWQFDK